MISFLLDYVNANFVLLVLALLILLTLTLKPKVSNTDFRPIYITVFSILLFTVLDRMETMITFQPAYYTQRLILSVLCYWLRPIFSLGLIYVIVTEKKRRILIAVPEIINVLVMGLAFLPGIGHYVFYFDADFNFQRGPLGYTIFIIGFLYVLYLLYLVFFRLREKNAKETLLIVVCAMCIIVSCLVEACGFLHNATAPLVLISCLVYYLTIYFQLTSVDVLTGLYNRETFYQDSEGKHITAIAAIDMNGLKQLNDTHGHEAGDIALKAIGNVIARNAHSDSRRGYRVGGDEFVVIFRNLEESAVKEVCELIRSEVAEAGYSVAVGYACRSREDEAVNDLLKMSDARMYADKDAFYSDTGSRH